LFTFYFCFLFKNNTILVPKITGINSGIKCNNFHDLHMGLRLKILIFLVFMVSLTLRGQTRSSVRMLGKARKAWELRDFRRAGVFARQVLHREPGYYEALLLMADICHETDSVESEAGYLRKAAVSGPVTPLLAFRLGEAEFKTARYEEAAVWVERFLETEPQGNLRARALELRKHAAFAVGAVKNRVDYEPISLGEGVNTSFDEYWPSLTVDGSLLVFTRLLPVEGSSSFFQEDFFMSRHDSAGWQTAVPLDELNTPMNEGAQAVSANGKLLFFTLCNHPEGLGSCDIWLSKRKEGKWAPPVNAGPVINTGGWEGQPSFSAFGDVLYFSSTRPGGKGKKDLWMATLLGWDSHGLPLWSEPLNAGDSVNTPGDEISPFIHPNGRDLFFASDGWPGFGGYDLFRSQRSPSGLFSAPLNLGYPLNSPGNEQGLIIDRTGETAFFSTNLVRGGNMDLYSFKTDSRIRPDPVTYLRGRVVNAVTGMPVSAEVVVSESGGGSFTSINLHPGEEGVFLVTLPPEKELRFSVSKPGYLFYSEVFRFEEPSSFSVPLERKIALEPALPGKSVDLYNIFFATNEYRLLPGSEPELQLLLDFLRKNPALKVEIGGHTDNTGSAEFNLGLSERRAESVRHYLLERGIGEGRISSRGYGQEQPVASNDTGEGRSKNRRTTVRITQ